jgi:TetR/AcrR family transcriptional regulator, regulator of autoinduction and epiphytic fitness
VSSGTAAPGARLTDGRILRAERTRRLVVETFLDLVQEGELHPTAQQVSDRSGVSMRSIFRLFQDVDALHSAAIAAQLERVAHLFEAPDATGPVEWRMTALVAQRTRLYETIAPVRRMAIRLAPRSLPIAAELARANAILRDHLTQLFAPELAAMRSGREAEAIEALDALTSWETWERLRSAQRLDVDGAARVVTILALGVLG